MVDLAKRKLYDEFGGLLELEEETQEFDEFGGIIEREDEPRSWRQGPITGEQIITNYVRPVLQGIGTAGGILVGGGTGALGGPTAPATIPLGMVAGGGLGYAIGDDLADLLEQFLGMRKPQPMLMEFKEAAEDVATGLTYEMGGHAIAPAAKGVMALPKVGPTLQRTGEGIKRFLTSIPMSAKGAKRKTGEVLAAMVNNSPLIVENAEQARALEDAIPGLKFNLAQLTDDPNIIDFVKAQGISDVEFTKLMAHQNNENVKAISQFIEKTKGKFNIDDAIERIAGRKKALDLGLETSEKALARETGALEAEISPMDIGGTISGELTAAEQAARKRAGEMFDAVPDQIQIVDDLLDEFNKIMKPTHPAEGSKRFPGVLSRSIKDMTESAKVGEPTMTLKHLQGLRSEILDDLRMAIDKGAPRQLRKRLADAIDIIDKKLSGEVQEKAGKTLYHSSDKIFKSGKPEAPEVHFFDEPDMGFGDNLYKINLPKSTKILDLEKVSKSKKVEFFKKIAGKEVDPNEYTKYWSESKKLTKIAKEMGYDAVSFDKDRFVIPQNLIQKGKTPSKELKAAQQYFKKEVIDKYHIGASKKILGESVQEADVASKYFKPGAAGEQSASEFMTSLGDNSAAQIAMKEHIGQNLLDSPAFSHKTGEISAAGLRKWRHMYRHALKKMGLTKEFDSLTKARKATDEALAKSREFEKSAASKMLNADVDKAVQKAFATGSKKKAAEDLIEQLKVQDIIRNRENVDAALKNLKTGKVYKGKPTHGEVMADVVDKVLEGGKIRPKDFNVDEFEQGFIVNGKYITKKQAIKNIKIQDEKAIKGLQNAFVDDMLGQASLEKADIIELFTSKKMKAELRKYDTAAKVLFKNSPEKLRAMRQVRKAVEFLERTTSLPKGTGKKRLESLITIMAKRYGFHKRALANVVTTAIGPFKKFSNAQIDTLMSRALLDPDFAYGLMYAARGGKPEKATRLIVQNLIRLGLVRPKEKKKEEED